jgi:CBS-domain-containing membrane protein
VICRPFAVLMKLMQWDFRKTAKEAGRSVVGPRGLAQGAAAGLGAAIAIGAMEWFAYAADYPLAFIPFATSIALVMGAPDAEPAQPRALLGGHLVSTVVGLVVLKLTGPHAWAAAVAVGLAILAMVATGTFHPPAGINPLLVVVNHLGWSFLFVPVLAGALLLTLFAYLWHRWLRPPPLPEPWPRRWL